jgi:hypothetical protein
MRESALRKRSSARATPTSGFIFFLDEHMLGMPNHRFPNTLSYSDRLTRRGFALARYKLSRALPVRNKSTVTVCPFALSVVLDFNHNALAKLGLEMVSGRELSFMDSPSVNNLII